MKVKIFEHVFANDERHEGLVQIEDKINRWLASSPGIVIRDIKLSTCAGTNHERAAPTNFAALCLVLYEER